MFPCLFSILTNLLAIEIVVANPYRTSLIFKYVLFKGYLARLFVNEQLLMILNFFSSKLLYLLIKKHRPLIGCEEVFVNYSVKTLSKMHLSSFIN
jgi:hypothetical protein